jgi:hypothetical protein
VPLLGDIPILEWAFRFDQNNCEKRELLILMTPHVVRSPADAERIKQIETERMDWVEEEVEAVHGPIYGIPADGSPETDPLLLDEFPATEDGGTDPYFSSAETVTSGENPTAVSPKATSNTPELLPAGAQGISEKRDGSPERKQRQGGRLWNLFRRGKE